MFKTARKVSTVCSVLAWLFSMPCKAAIPPHLLTNQDYEKQAQPRQIVLFFPSYQDLGRGQDARSIQPVEQVAGITSADIGRVIPAQKMAETCQTSRAMPNAPIATTIFGYSLGNYLKSPAIKQSSVGRTAQNVQESMKAEGSFGGTAPGDIKHSFVMNLNPFETKAEMKYKGYTNASLTYTLMAAKLDFEMYRDLNKSTKLVFNHTDTRFDTRELVSLRWVWN